MQLISTGSAQNEAGDMRLASNSWDARKDGEKTLVQQLVLQRDVYWRRAMHLDACTELPQLFGKPPDLHDNFLESLDGLIGRDLAVPVPIYSCPYPLTHILILRH